MKVILLVDDKKLGKKNTVRDVADGYARNLLIPRKIVEEATPDAISRLNDRLAKEKREYVLKLADARSLKEKILALGKLVIKVKLSNSGKMFGSITNKTISEELNKVGISVDKKDIVMENKSTTGIFNAEIKLFGNQSVTLPVEIINC